MKRSLGTRYARLKLALYLWLTGFDHFAYTTEDGSGRSSTTEVFTKDDLRVEITSIYSVGCFKFAIIDYPSCSEKLDANKESRTDALNAVKAAFPDEKPNIVRYLLKPICIKIFPILGGLLILILIIKMGGYAAEYFRGQFRFVKAPIPLIGVAIAGIVCILNATRQLFMRISLAAAWLGILTWFAWRFLLIH